MLSINKILKTEELLMFFLSVYLFNLLTFKWFVFAVLFLTPDISMLGYLINNKTGQRTYNLFHHKGIAMILYLTGLYFKNELIQLAGIILFGHSSLDRFFGFGLKLQEGFKYTHLGKLN